VRTGEGTTTAFQAPGAGSGYLLGTWSESINGAGDVAGYYQNDGFVYGGFVRTGDGKITSFQVPGAGTAEFTGTIGRGINDAGMVAGYCWDANNVGHGFLLTP
jgi:hypothetical protein